MAFASWLITPNGRLDPTSAVPFSPADSSKRWNKLSRLNVTYQCADIFFLSEYICEILHTSIVLVGDINHPHLGDQNH